MTIDEAIIRIEVFIKDVSEEAPELLDDAMRLGIEALKRIKDSRYLKCQVASDKLPGETEE